MQAQPSTRTKPAFGTSSVAVATAAWLMAGTQRLGPVAYATRLSLERLALLMSPMVSEPVLTLEPTTASLLSCLVPTDPAGKVIAA
jgi:hypothetical protein